MLVQHSGSQSAECLVCSADPSVDLLVEGAVNGDDTAGIFELTYIVFSAYRPSFS